MSGTTGATALAKMLEGYGVTHVFMVPAVLRRTMVEMERGGDIARIHTHGEPAAAYMADGYARAVGRPGICMAQVVGARNLASGLRDAWLAHSPVMAFTGGRDPLTRDRKVYQEVDDLPAFEGITKMNLALDAPERIPDMVRQAFRVAVTGTPGPVHLQFQGNEGQMDAREADLDPYVEPEYGSIPPFRPRCDDRVLERAIDEISGAERPVIVAGGGVRASDSGQALTAFAEKHSIPVATSLNGKDSLPGRHPLAVGVVGTYSRGAANQVVAGADLVIFVGSETGSMTTHFWHVPVPGVRAIQVDIEPQSLGRNYPLQVAVQADARSALTRMLELSQNLEVPARESWSNRVAQICGNWREEFREVMESEQVPIRPERICAELSDHVPSDAIVVVDTGHAGMWMGGFFDVGSPHQSYIRSAGHLGWAFPASMGAKCAAPDRPVISFTGDAGLWYHLGEIETAVRWNINTVTVVNNNHSGNQSKRGFDRAYEGRQTEEGRRLWTFSEVDFAAMARQMGAEGIRVEKPKDLSSALERAFDAERPVLIDVVTDIEALAPPPVSP